MARVEAATQSWGVIQDRLGNVVVGEPFTSTATFYDAAVGGSPITGAALKTNADGELPGYVDVGTWTITVRGETKLIEAFSGLDSARLDTVASGVFTTAVKSRAADGSLITAKTAADTADGLFNWIHDGDEYLLHFVSGPTPSSNRALIACGIDNGGSGILLANKATGIGLYVHQQSTISAAGANGIRGLQQSNVASLIYIDQKVNDAAPALELVNTAAAPAAGTRMLKFFSTAAGGEFGWVDASSGKLTWTKEISVSNGGTFTSLGTTTIGSATGANGMAIYGKPTVYLVPTSPTIAQEWRTNDGSAIIAKLNADGSLDLTNNAALGSTGYVLFAGGRGRIGYDNQVIRVDDNGTNKAVAISAGGAERVRANATGLGFFAATPVAKPTVTGSRGGNAALASALTALASLGLITDSSTA